MAIRQFEYLAEVESERFLGSLLKIPTQSVADLAISERDDIQSDDQFYFEIRTKLI